MVHNYIIKLEEKALFENAGCFQTVMSDGNIEGEFFNFWNFETNGRFYCYYQSFANCKLSLRFFIAQIKKFGKRLLLQRVITVVSVPLMRFF